MVDKETLARRLDVLLDALADLRRYRSRFDEAALTTDRDAQHMVQHALYVAAQAAIDIALHAGAAEEQRAATTYQESFERLATAGLIDADLTKRMMGWAGLRNVLAHQYGTIDHARIAATLAHELGDLEQFASAASGWLDAKADGGPSPSSAT